MCASVGSMRVSLMFLCLYSSTNLNETKSKEKPLDVFLYNVDLLLPLFFVCCCFYVRNILVELCCNIGLEQNK